uniref:EF-hand domain-containing protein n=1 Tax=Cucumis melo TaxID=3656 RepID=A0A9I9CZF5_CUCME
MGTSNASIFKHFSASLTEFEVAKVFNNYDRDGDGRLTKEELKSAFKYLGYKFTTIRVHQALHAADNNCDDVISFEEISKLIIYTAGS